MASTINATTSSGIVATADNTGQLALQANGTTVMTVTSTGVTTQVGAPAFSVNLASSTTVTLSAYVKVPFNSKVFDTNNNFDATTNYRFTPTVAGYYQITLIMLGSASATGQYPNIYKNGSAIQAGTIAAGVTGIGVATMSSGLISMNGTTDYLEAYVYQTGNANISGGVGGCNFSGFLARSA